MKPELIKKIESELSLHPNEEAAVDTYLSEAESAKIASLIQGLPKEMPSLAWRASLNEKITRIASKPVPIGKRLAPFGLGALIGSGVMALAFVVALNHQSETKSPYDVEVLGKAILEWHEEAVASSVLPGDRITLELTPPSSQTNDTNTLDDLLYGGPFDQL
jgi:hypothetical protein